MNAAPLRLRLRHRTIISGSPIQRVLPYLGETLVAIAADGKTALRIFEANDRAYEDEASEFPGRTMLTHGEPCVLRIVPGDSRGCAFCTITPVPRQTEESAGE